MQDSRSVRFFSRRAERKRSVIRLETVAWVFWHMALSHTVAKIGMVALKIFSFLPKAETLQIA